MPSDDEDLQDIATLLYSHQRTTVMLGSSLNQNNVEFILRVKGKEETRIHSVSVSVNLNFTSLLQRLKSDDHALLVIATVCVVCVRGDKSHISGRRRKGQRLRKA